MQINKIKRRVEIAPWIVDDLKGKLDYEIYQIEELSVLEWIDSSYPSYQLFCLV